MCEPNIGLYFFIMNANSPKSYLDVQSLAMKLDFCWICKISYYSHNMKNPKMVYTSFERPKGKL